MLAITFDYGLGMPLFDTTNSRQAGVAAPPVVQYFERVLAFASRERFGRPAEPRAVQDHVAPASSTILSHTGRHTSVDTLR